MKRKVSNDFLPRFTTSPKKIADLCLLRILFYSGVFEACHNNPEHHLSHNPYFNLMKCIRFTKGKFRDVSVKTTAIIVNHAVGAFH